MFPFFNHALNTARVWGPGADWETYRKLALHCLRAADKVRDPGMRLALLSLATKYIALADYADRRHEHGTAHPGDYACKAASAVGARGF